MPTGDLNITENADTLATKQPTAALGTTYTDLILNAWWRGVVGTPATTVYFSIGETHSTLIPAELSGVVRTPVKVNRGWLNGLDTATYPYQSSGNDTFNNQNCQAPIDIYCGSITTTVGKWVIMIFDAPTGGNLLLAYEPALTNMPEVVSGDIIRISDSNINIASDGTCSESQKYLPMWTRGNSAFAAHAYGMNIDWLFRGFDAINTGYNPSTSPNLYVCFGTSGGAVIPEIPRKAVARNTTNWSAPAARQSGVNLERIIRNLVDITIGPATADNGYSNPTLQFRMASTAQSFDDKFYEIQMLIGTFTVTTGDSYLFPAGAIEIVLT